LSLILLIPPFVVAVLIDAIFGAALLGLGLAVLLAIVEGAALIGVAAWRLDGHVDRLAA
jgi:hypothetical protein